jgi:hypothetical protein
MPKQKYEKISTRKWRINGNNNDGRIKQMLMGTNRINTERVDDAN